MVRINLLPHRAIKRAERQRQFGLMLAATVALGVVIVFLGLGFINNKISAQQERNERLTRSIESSSKEIEQIKTLKEDINKVLERKRVVESLQSGRSQTVVLLNEISRQLPDGVYINSIKQSGNIVALDGVADSNARVASLVRNLEKSAGFESPLLIETKAITVNKGLKQNAFSIQVIQKAQTPG